MARRGTNEGSIYKRADGRWAGVIHLGYEGGRRRRKAIYGKTRQEVAASSPLRSRRSRTASHCPEIARHANCSSASGWRASSLRYVRGHGHAMRA